MGAGRANNFGLVTTLFILRWVTAQDYYEEHHKNEIRSPVGHLSEIPKRFEVRGENAMNAFSKYLTDIQTLAKSKNLTILYRVKVDSAKSTKRRNYKERLQKGRSKKFLVLLKKKNMKLSSFEVILRKRANDLSVQRNYEDISTTERQKVIFTTRQVPIGKYKPVVGGVRTNYLKIVRPVRNKIITVET